MKILRFKIKQQICLNNVALKICEVLEIFSLENKEYI